VTAGRPGAKCLLLREIQHCVCEVGTVNHSIAETTLHQHAVAQLGIAEIAALEAGGIGHHVLQVCSAQVGSLQIRAVEHGPTQVSFAEVVARQGRLEEFSLLQVAAVHIGLQILEGPLTPKFGSRDRLSRKLPDQQCQQAEQASPQGADERAGQGAGHGRRPTLDPQVMATMAMTLRVVVPPHPLIGHWLSVLRDRKTPAPLYVAACNELGRWLTYEALRQWLPYRPVEVETEGGPTAGQVVDSSVPILACVLGTSALGLWDGARPVLPNTRVLHLDAANLQLPEQLDSRSGVLVFCSEVASGARLELLLNALAERGLRGERVRVITTLVANPGLQRLAESFPDLTLHTACIDAELDACGRIRPGIGCVQERLFAGPALEAAAHPA
jgi:uracil phosphoribosyltransferase